MALTIISDSEFSRLEEATLYDLSEGDKFVYDDDLESPRYVETVFEQRGTRTLVGVTREEFAPFGTSLAVSSRTLIRKISPKLLKTLRRRSVR